MTPCPQRLAYVPWLSNMRVNGAPGHPTIMNGIPLSMDILCALTIGA